MSYILKALRKSQMERDLGKIPTLEVPYHPEPEKAPRRWWPWMLALALLANLGIMAAYAWEYVIPVGEEGAAHSRAVNTVVQELPPTSATPAIPGLETDQNPASQTEDAPRTAGPEAADETTEAMDQAALAEAFKLVPAETGGGAPEENLQPPAELSHVLTPAVPSQVPASTTQEGARSGPESRSLAQPSLEEAPPGADPVPSAARQIAQLDPPPAAASPPAEAPSLVPRRRPKGEAWSGKIAAAMQTQAAALAEPQAAAALPPVNAAQEVSQVPLVPPQEVPEEGLTGETAPAQTAHVPVDLEKTIGELDGGGTTTRDEDLPRYEQLSRELRSEIPQIKLSAHVFDPDPQRRFARINKEKFREGDEVAQGLWLDAVTTQGVILRYADTRFWMGSF